MQQPTRRERKKEETRKRIIDAAFQLFIENGFDNTSVDLITSKADVGKGTFYNYYCSKGALLYDLMEIIGEQRGEQIWPSVIKLEDTRQRLAKAFASLASWFETYPDLMRAYVQEVYIQDRMKITASTDIKRYQPNSMEIYLLEIFKLGQKSGDIRDDLDPMQLVSYLGGVFFVQIFLWYENGSKPGLYDEIMRAVDFFLIGALSTEK